METRNLTLHLPADLIRKAKVYAARRDTSLNRLVKELLEEKVLAEDKYRAAADRILELVKNGPYTDVDPRTITRDEMHERW